MYLADLFIINQSSSTLPKIQFKIKLAAITIIIGIVYYCFRIFTAMKKRLINRG